MMTELKSLNADYHNLQTESRTLEEASKETEYLTRRLEEARDQRNRMQREFDALQKQPFFKRESDQSSFQRINELQKLISERELAIKGSREVIVKADEKLRELNEEQRNVAADKDAYKEEIDRLDMQLDPTALSMADIQRKLHDLDPSKFREVMKDLKYDGEEPVWAQMDFMERLNLGQKGGAVGDDVNDPAVLKKEVERLKVERRDLAAELEKVQNLLKM